MKRAFTFLLLIVTSCHSRPTPDPDGAKSELSDTSISRCLLPKSPAPLPPKSILFALGSLEIDASQENLIKDWFTYIARYPEKRFSIEGHTDSQGSNEFNLRFGLYRAGAVYRKLLAMGVNPSQMRIISFGEELPANSNSGTVADQENRRVSLYEIYKKRP